jgi:UPF0716 family protein affecting phage T7 exclusion
MPRYPGFLSTGLAMLLLAAPASALTSKEKMETCKIGAQAQKLTGAKRDAFIKKCMAQAPVQRVSAKQKMETCKVGADSQKLAGAKRNAFIKKCMAKGNYEPPARRALKENAMKKPPPKQN